MDVVVVGAGLGGLAAAVALHRAGHEVTVLEQAPEPRENGAGIGIMPNGVLALDALGLGAPVRAHAAPIEAGGGIRDRHGVPLLAADQRAVQLRTGAPVVVVPRRWLHALLAAALPAGTIRVDFPVAAVQEDGGRVHVAGTARRGVVADAVVVADGAGSRLRAALFPQHPGLVGSGEQAARAIAPTAPAGVSLAAGELLDRRTGDRFGCLPMAGGGVYWYATWDGARAGGPDEPAARHRWLRARRADWHPCAVALIDLTPPDAIHVVETAQLARPLPALAVGRIAITGDAAHAMTPDLGQGAGQAFEDAVALGTVLCGAGPPDVAAALARYDARRRPRTTAMMRQARRANRVFRLRGTPARVRDAGLRSVPGRLATRALASQLRFEPEPVAGLR